MAAEKRDFGGIKAILGRGEAVAKATGGRQIKFEVDSVS